MGYFGHFYISRILWSFLGSKRILVIFRLRGHFSNFLGFGGITVIF